MNLKNLFYSFNQGKFVLDLKKQGNFVRSFNSVLLDIRIRDLQLFVWYQNCCVQNETLLKMYFYLFFCGLGICYVLLKIFKLPFCSFSLKYYSVVIKFSIGFLLLFIYLKFGSGNGKVKN